MSLISKKEKCQDALSHSGISTEASLGLVLGFDSGIKGCSFWQWDLLTDQLVFSAEWRRVMRLEGSGPVTYIHREWASSIHEGDLEELREIRDKILAGYCTDITLVFRIQRADKCWAWLLVWGHVAFTPEGEPERACGTVTDISALRADKKFQQGNVGVGDAAYHAMLENSPDILVRLDRELFPLYINPIVSRYMGRESHEYSFSEGLDDLKIDPEHLAFLKKNVDWVFEQRTFIREMVTFQDAFGRVVTGEYSFWPEFDQKGNVISAMTQFRDLTDQVQAEKSAHDNEKRLTALYNLTQMDDSSEQEVMRYVLQSLVQLTGSRTAFFFIPQGDLDGPGHMAWIAGRRKYFNKQHFIKKTFLRGLTAYGVTTDDPGSFRMIMNGDGKRPVIPSHENVFKIMRGAMVPVTENGRIVCLAGVGNKEKPYEEGDLKQLEMFLSGAWLVLRRHEYIRELHAAKETAEHANRVKDEFLANVSHELRTPLNGLLGMLQLMEDMPLSEEQREYIRAANLSGNALLRIISDILDFSRMAHGKMELRNEVFDLKQTISSALRLFRREAVKKGLEFALKIDEAIPDALLGDDARVRQILFNLVGNALKFTEKGSIEVTCGFSGRKDLAAGETEVVLSVADTGIGIPQEQQSKIFEAFTQVDSSSTRKYQGTGLGLGIVRRLVNLMNGSITLESEVGRGTKVSCYLQFSRPETVENTHGTLSARLLASRTSLDILVAEDDSVSRFAIRSFLKRLGHRTVCVQNGAEAVAALKLYPFDCLLTDIQMPDMDGLELVERIRGNRVDDIPVSDDIRYLVGETFQYRKPEELPINRDITIIAVSAHAMTGDKERFIEQGMNDYISKPIVNEELASVLARLAERIDKDAGA